MSVNIFLYAVGFLLFVLNYKKLKIYAYFFMEFYGIIFLLLFLDAILLYFFLNEVLGILSIFLILLTLPGLIMMAASGLYYLKKLNFTKSFSIVTFNRYGTIQGWRTGIIVGSALSLISIFPLWLKNYQIYNPPSLSFFNVGMLTLSAIIISAREETIFRLFLLPSLTFLFRKLRIAFLLAAVISSLLSVIMYYEFRGMNLVIMIQLFVISIIWSYLFKKKGWDACFLGHTVFNIINFVILGNMHFLMRQ